MKKFVRGRIGRVLCALLLILLVSPSLLLPLTSPANAANGKQHILLLPFDVSAADAPSSLAKAIEQQFVVALQARPGVEVEKFSPKSSDIRHVMESFKKNGASSDKDSKQGKDDEATVQTYIDTAMDTGAGKDDRMKAAAALGSLLSMDAVIFGSVSGYDLVNVKGGKQVRSILFDGTVVEVKNSSDSANSEPYGTSIKAKGFSTPSDLPNLAVSNVDMDREAITQLAEKFAQNYTHESVDLSAKAPAGDSPIQVKKSHSSLPWIISGIVLIAVVAVVASGGHSGSSSNVTPPPTNIVDPVNLQANLFPAANGGAGYYIKLTWTMPNGSNPTSFSIYRTSTAGRGMKDYTPSSLNQIGSTPKAPIGRATRMGTKGSTSSSRLAPSMIRQPSAFAANVSGTPYASFVNTGVWSFTDNNVVVGNSYTYSLVAMYGTVSSPSAVSVTKSVTVSTFEVQGLTIATAAGDVSLNWAPPSGVIGTEYHIYRSPSFSGILATMDSVKNYFGRVGQGTTIPWTTTSFIDTSNLTGGATYSYVVVPVVGGVEDGGPYPVVAIQPAAVTDVKIATFAASTTNAQIYYSVDPHDQYPSATPTLSTAITINGMTAASTAPVVPAAPAAGAKVKIVTTAGSFVQSGTDQIVSTDGKTVIGLLDANGNITIVFQGRARNASQTAMYVPTAADLGTPTFSITNFGVTTQLVKSATVLLPILIGPPSSIAVTLTVPVQPAATPLPLATDLLTGQSLAISALVKDLNGNVVFPGTPIWLTQSWQPLSGLTNYADASYANEAAGGGNLADTIGLTDGTGTVSSAFSSAHSGAYTIYAYGVTPAYDLSALAAVNTNSTGGVYAASALTPIANSLLSQGGAPVKSPITNCTVLEISLPNLTSVNSWFPVVTHSYINYSDVTVGTKITLTANDADGKRVLPGSYFTAASVQDLGNGTTGGAIGTLANADYSALSSPVVFLSTAAVSSVTLTLVGTSAAAATAGQAQVGIAQLQLSEPFATAPPLLTNDLVTLYGPSLNNAIDNPPANGAITMAPGNILAGQGDIAATTAKSTTVTLTLKDIAGTAFPSGYIVKVTSQAPTPGGPSSSSGVTDATGKFTFIYNSPDLTSLNLDQFVDTLAITVSGPVLNGLTTRSVWASSTTITTERPTTATRTSAYSATKIYPVTVGAVVAPPVPISLTAYPSTNAAATAVGAGYPIKFILTPVTGASDTTLTATSVLTDATGSVSINLQAGLLAGVVTVDAYYDKDNSGKMLVSANTVLNEKLMPTLTFNIGVMPPTNLTATININPSQVVLNWNAVANADGYLVSRSSDGGVTYVPIIVVNGYTVAVPTVTYTDKTVVLGNTYIYQVVAVNLASALSSTPATSNSVTLTGLPPAKISVLPSAATVPDSLTPGATIPVTATVVDSNGNIVSAGIPITFVVKPVDGTTTMTPSPQVANTNANGVATVNMTLGATFGRVTVVAYYDLNGDGIMEATETNGNSGILPIGLPAPTNVTAVYQAPTSVVISWVAWPGVPQYGVGYMVERAPDVAGVPGAWTKLIPLGSIMTVSNLTTTTYTDATGVPGATYWYRVSDVDIPNNLVSATTQTVTSVAIPALPPASATVNPTSTTYGVYPYNTSVPVTTTVLAANGTPVVAGTTINFLLKYHTAANGSFLSALSAPTNALGVVTINLNTGATYGTLEIDPFYDANGDGIAQANELLGGTTGLIVVGLPQVTNFTGAYTAATNSETLNWSSGLYEDGYLISRETDSSGIWVPLYPVGSTQYTVAAGANTYTDTTMSPGHTYNFEIAEVTVSGVSSIPTANVVQVIIPGIMPVSGIIAPKTATVSYQSPGTTIPITLTCVGKNNAVVTDGAVIQFVIIPVDGATATWIAPIMTDINKPYVTSAPTVSGVATVNLVLPATYGEVSIQAYYDTNGDGRRQPNELLDTSGTLLCGLPAPTNVTVSPLAPASAILNWTDTKPTHTEGYTVFRSTDGINFSPIIPLGATYTVAVGTTTYTDKNLTPGKSYWYEVESVNITQGEVSTLVPSTPVSIVAPTTGAVNTYTLTNASASIYFSTNADDSLSTTAPTQTQLTIYGANELGAKAAGATIAITTDKGHFGALVPTQSLSNAATTITCVLDAFGNTTFNFFGRNHDYGKYTPANSVTELGQPSFQIVNQGVTTQIPTTQAGMPSLIGAPDKITLTTSAPPALPVAQPDAYPVIFSNTQMTITAAVKDALGQPVLDGMPIWTTQSWTPLPAAETHNINEPNADLNYYTKAFSCANVQNFLGATTGGTFVSTVQSNHSGLFNFQVFALVKAYSTTTLTQYTNDQTKGGLPLVIPAAVSSNLLLNAANKTITGNTYVMCKTFVYSADGAQHWVPGAVSTARIYSDANAASTVTYYGTDIDFKDVCPGTYFSVTSSPGSKLTTTSGAVTTNVAFGGGVGSGSNASILIYSDTSAQTIGMVSLTFDNLSAAASHTTILNSGVTIYGPTFSTVVHTPIVSITPLSGTVWANTGSTGPRMGGEPFGLLDPLAASTLLIKIQLSDKNGNPFPAGYLVNVSTKGESLTPVPVATDTSGQATITYNPSQEFLYSANDDYIDTLTFIIIGEEQGGQVTYYDNQIPAQWTNTSGSLVYTSSDKTIELEAPFNAVVSPQNDPDYYPFSSTFPVTFRVTKNANGDSLLPQTYQFTIAEDPAPTATDTTVAAASPQDAPNMSASFTTGTIAGSLSIGATWNVRTFDTGTIFVGLTTPSTVTATPLSFSSNTLTWDTDSAATNYRVEYEAPTLGVNTWTTINPTVVSGATVSAGVTIGALQSNLTHTGLQWNTAYTYRVTSYRLGGKHGIVSSLASATPIATTLYPAPLAPTGVGAVPGAAGQIIVSWTPQIPNYATGYFVSFEQIDTYTAAVVGPPAVPAFWTPIPGATFNGGVLTAGSPYTLAGLASNCHYLVRVCSTNPTGPNSAWVQAPGQVTVP